MSENFKKNQIQVFENNEFGAMRTAFIDDEVWFAGKDVAEILGYERETKASSGEGSVQTQRSVGFVQQISE